MANFEARETGYKDQSGRTVFVIMNTSTHKPLPRRQFTDTGLAMQEAAELCKKVKGVYGRSKAAQV